MRATRRRRVGYTVIELIVAMTILGLMTGIVALRLRVTPAQRVRAAGVQLAQDLEAARTRALSTRRAARVVFDVAGGRYRGYLANPGVATFSQSAAEANALGTLRDRPLTDGVTFGRGSAPQLDGDAGNGAVTLASNRVDFTSRGLTTPFGARGTIYLTHRDDPTSVVAVAVSGGGSFRVWVHRPGGWE